MGRFEGIHDQLFDGAGVRNAIEADAIRVGGTPGIVVIGRGQASREEDVAGSVAALVALDLPMSWAV
ncbi:MAG TPA: hypothetical protein VFB21_26230 [Chthonomonadaceae bacterium]|nr:hypothetical protein [Chthonomonadaceae bacterium]